MLSGTGLSSGYPDAIDTIEIPHSQFCFLSIASSYSPSKAEISINIPQFINSIKLT